MEKLIDDYRWDDNKTSAILIAPMDHITVAYRAPEEEVDDGRDREERGFKMTISNLREGG